MTTPNRRVFLSSIAAATTGLLAGCSDTDSPLGGTQYINDIETDGLTLTIPLENEEDISQLVVDTPSEPAAERTSIDAGIDHVEFGLYANQWDGDRMPERGEYVFTVYDDEDEELDSKIYQYNPEIAINHVDMTWTEGETQYGSSIDLLGIEFTIENTSNVPVLITEFYYDDVDDMTSGVLTDYPYVTTGPFDVEADTEDSVNVLEAGEERRYVAPEFLTNRFGGIPDHPNDCGYEMPGTLMIHYVDEVIEHDLDFFLGGERVNPDGSQIEYCDATEITSDTP